MKKIYFKVYNDDNGVYFRTGNMMVRFAGNPHFLLEKYIKKYGNTMGIKLYTELHEMLNEIGQDGFSPIVLYSKEEKDDKESK